MNGQDAAIPSASDIEKISADIVVSPEYFLKETEAIFKRAWLNIGREDDIPNPGDYFVKDLAFARASLVVVRGEDGVVRTFHNVCRHRADAVVTKNCGSSRRFQCRFHGWTYDNRGRLIFVPHEELYPGLDRAKFGLVEVATDVWQGFIYVNLAPKPPQTLREFLGTQLLERFGSYAFPSMRRASAYSATLDTNWKVFVDSFLDIGHVEYLHRQSFPDFFLALDSMATTQPSEVRFHNRHAWSLTESMAGTINTNRKPSATEALAVKFRPTGFVLDPKSDDPKVDAFKGVGFLFQFPNVIFDMFCGFYFIHRFFPVTVDRTEWQIEYFFEPPRNAGEKISQEYWTVINRDAVREDLSTVEAVYRNLSAGTVREYVLAVQDVFIRHNYKTVREAVEMRAP